MCRESKFFLITPKNLWSRSHRSTSQELMDIWYLIFAMISNENQDRSFITDHSSLYKSSHSFIKLFTNHIFFVNECIICNGKYFSNVYPNVNEMDFCSFKKWGERGDWLVLVIPNLTTTQWTKAARRKGAVFLFFLRTFILLIAFNYYRLQQNN